MKTCIAKKTVIYILRPVKITHYFSANFTVFPSDTEIYFLGSYI
jgi:hypothetical protein